MYCEVLGEPSPLGLKSRKSTSLLDLLEEKLSQTRSSAGQSAMDNSTFEPSIKNEIKSGALTAGERLKASNFPASFLIIGTWEYTTQYEGDLVAKFYYAKHKLVWEVLDAGLKAKIEIQWSHITALKATCPEDRDGTSDLMLSRPPLFFRLILNQENIHYGRLHQISLVDKQACKPKEAWQSQVMSHCSRH